MSNKIAVRTVLKKWIVAELDKKMLLNKKGDPWQKCLYISNHLLKRYKHQLTHVQVFIINLPEGASVHEWVEKNTHTHTHTKAIFYIATASFLCIFAVCADS